MGSVNSVAILGRLGADPELRYSAQSRPICNLRIATTETWKDKSGAKQEKTDWHRVVAFGDVAENAAKYLEKGREVYVSGKLQTRSYDKNGVKTYTTEIVADRVVFLGGGNGDRHAASDSGGGGYSRSAPRENDQPASGQPSPPDDDGIPF